MSPCGEKSAQAGSCAREALLGAATTGEPHGCVAKGTWQKVFASSDMKWSQAELRSSLPLGFCKEVKSLLGYSRTSLRWDGRNDMVIMNP